MMLELFPEGFEELDGDRGSVELAAYTNAAGEERIWQAFGGAAASDVADDWLDRWRQFHRPVRVGALWVGPPWERPDADAVPVVIDPGTQPGEVRALRGRGMPSLDRSGRGDHHVRVDVAVPRRLTDEQRELLDRFEQLSGEDTYRPDEGFFEKLRNAIR